MDAYNIIGGAVMLTALAAVLWVMILAITGRIG